MSSDHRNDWTWAFIDLLLCMFGLFVALFIVTMLQVNPAAKKAAVELKAEFIITVTWPDKAFDDIDTHVLLPDERMVNFLHRDSTFTTLDRDDLGVTNDMYTGPDGKKALIEQNREMITVRAIVPGVYVVNLHVYRAHKAVSLNGELKHTETPLPYKAKVTLQKLNPIVKELVAVDVPLTELGEQKTAFTFTVDADGNVSGIDTNADLPFIPITTKSASSAPPIIGDFGGYDP